MRSMRVSLAPANVTDLLSSKLPAPWCANAIGADINSTTANILRNIVIYCNGGLMTAATVTQQTSTPVGRLTWSTLFAWNGAQILVDRFQRAVRRISERRPRHDLQQTWRARYAWRNILQIRSGPHDQYKLI